ncbi:hypothetical protein M2408_000637 [Sphingobacterium sp. BIGb0165]|nr:hypothetical protein [Sphingobacterium sp. BIGb0165]
MFAKLIKEFGEMNLNLRINNDNERRQQTDTAPLSFYS